MKIPIIDIFAGPGGLGEGFSALLDEFQERVFKIVLSVEMDKYAHQTLTLRSFYRQFQPGKVPEEYYSFIRGRITPKQLNKIYPGEARKAKMEAWRAKLGEDEKSVSNKHIDYRIKKALGGATNWVLLGGPPCQAYSVIGRSRRQEKILDEQKDERVGLYKQYLRILAVHNPPVFVMENVKGLLSAKTEQNLVFSKILSDLTNPVRAYLSDFKNNGIKLECPGYRIYSLVAEPVCFDLYDQPVFRHKDFVVDCEKYGVPQTRHRVIILGIRNDIDHKPNVLEANMNIPISSVISGLPKLRSALSKSENSAKNWKATIKKINKIGSLRNVDQEVKNEIIKHLKQLALTEYESGDEYYEYKKMNIYYRPDWYLDDKLEGVCNHSSRGHMDSDVLRYFFASCFAKVKKRSPKLEDFPKELLPAHKNVEEGIENKKFSDRFRVQLWDKPCKTITSHISKDGHYYIHPDPIQCRSLTVREAARIQTFPDNYYFCGPRTAQYIQVGNAVPPIFAHHIARIVNNVFKSLHKTQNDYFNEVTADSNSKYYYED